MRYAKGWMAGSGPECLRGRLSLEGCWGCWLGADLTFSRFCRRVARFVHAPARPSSFEVTREPCVCVCVPVPIFARDLDVFGHKALEYSPDKRC